MISATQVVTMVAAGDIACDPVSPQFAAGAGNGRACMQRATADEVAVLRPDVVAVLGDDEYENGSLAAFQGSYDSTWGRFKSITRPAVGNHEYLTSGAAGYFDYFGSAAGQRGEGWYSYEAGPWHVVVLNSNCHEVGCKPGTPQLNWLHADLAAHSNQCLLAYWHHPLWSHGEYDGTKAVLPFVQALYDAGADVVLNGHDHNYERFDPRTPTGAADPAHGLREFVVGSGGRSHYPLRAGSGAAMTDGATFGVLQLTLRRDGYDWQFQPVAGGTFTDQGSSSCHHPV